MKKKFLLTAASLLAIETAYAIPGRDQLGDESLTTVSLRSTRAPRKTSEKAFSEGFEYRWQMKTNGTLGHSVRRTTEETPYVDLRALLRTNPAMPEDQQYSVKFSEEDIGQILDLYRTGKFQLSWDQDGLAYQQYCAHPLDGFHTLAVTSSQGKTYYKQQRWDGEIGNSPVIDVFADSKSQLEYRFDPDSQQWLIERRKGSSRFSDRENAVKALKKLGLKYELKDRARGEYSSEPFYSFTDLATRWALDEVERAKDAAYRPSLWKTLPMGWLALTSGGILNVIQRGLTTSFASSQPMQPDDGVKSLDQSSTVQVTSYSVSSLTDLVVRAAPYAVTPVLLSMVSSSKSGLRSPLGILATFGLGELGSVAAQYTSDDQPEDGYVPPMGPVFQISNSKEQFNFNPSAATLTNGDPIVVWFSHPTPRDPYSIYGCVIRGEKCINDSPFLISINNECNPSSTPSEENPVVASLSNGNAVVAWQGSHNPYSDGAGSICETVVNMTGPISPPRNISSNIGVPFNMKIAGLSSGKALAIWPGYNYDNFIFGMYGIHIDSQGNPIDQSPFRISNDYGESYSISGLSNGNTFVTVSDFPNMDLYGYIVNGNQVKYKTDLQASGLYPVSTVIDGAAVFVAWVDRDGIYGELLSKNGTILSNPILISQNISDPNVVYPSMSILVNGNLFISWLNADVGSVVGKAYGKIINSEGASITRAFQISDDNVDAFSKTSVTSLHDGNVFVTWEENGYGASYIYGRIVYTNQTQNK